MNTQRFALRCALPITLAALAWGLLATAPAVAQPLQVGKYVPYPAEPGDVGRPWTLTIEHPGATFIAVHFDRFELPPGARVFVESPDHAQRYGYTGRGKGDAGTFFAAHIMGDRAIVSLVGARGIGALSIAGYSAGTDAFLQQPGTEAICTGDDLVNAICYNDGVGGDDEPAAYAQSRAVARLLTNKGAQGSFLCTGWLVGCEGHFMANNHCIENQVHATNTDYEFDSEAPTCGSANGQLFWTGTIWGGAATLVQTSVRHDYSLVHLTGNPQSTYGSFTMDDRVAAVGEQIYMPQHPAGNAKELGIVSTDPVDAPGGVCRIGNNDHYACIGGLSEYGYQCDTQGGSSGSPVVAYANHKVLGIHHCGLCGTGTFGNIGVPSSVLVRELESIAPGCFTGPGADLRLVSYGIDDSAVGNNDGLVDPGEVVRLSVVLRNIGAVTATTVAAALSTTTSGVTVTGAAASWPSILAGTNATTLPAHFEISIDPTISCGTLIDFDLAITSLEGGMQAEFFEAVVGGASGTLATVTYPSAGAVAIPDFNPTGATSTISISDAAVIGNLEVGVNITHTFRGDLALDLLSPAGTAVRLHTIKNDPAANIITTYDSLTVPEGPGVMSDFDGESLAGDWKLRATDAGPIDLGTINSWNVQVDPISFTCNVFVPSAAGAVPDGATVPGTQLTVSHAAGDDVTLAWGTSCNVGDTDYEIYEGTMGSFSSHVDIACSTAGATTSTFTPGVGSTYYLVVPAGATREGSYGVDSAGSERGQGASACLTQSIAGCL